MAKVTLKAGALLAPLPPVMVSTSKDGKNNIITVAWTGILNTIPPKTYVSVRESRHSYSMIRDTGEFVINLTPSSLVYAADYCGMFTGAKKDKFKECHLTPEPSEFVSVPGIAECPVSLECRVCGIKEMGTHHVFEADILGVRVDEALLDKNGRLCIERAKLAAYAHGEYFELGRKLGKFGFSAAKKKNRSPKRERSGSAAEKKSVPSKKKQK